MKQIFLTNKGYKALDAAMPTPGENELLVAVYSSVISTGTETMGMKKSGTTLLKKLNEKRILLDKVIYYLQKDGLKPTLETIIERLSPAEKSYIFQPVGYSNSGIVVAKGQLVKNFSVGDRVACAGSGIAAHAEFTVIPVNLAVKIPDEVPFESAGFTTIGAIAMQGIRRANVTFGETVVITGLGLLGLIAVQIAKAWGLVVIGTDLNPSKLDMARELGADYCFNANDTNFNQVVQDITYGHGADAVIIYAATESSDPANQAFKVCRKKGRVVVVGAIGMDLQREDMYLKELDFVISTSYGPGRYDSQYELKGIDYPIGYVRWTENRNMMEFVKLLANGQVKVDRLISNTFRIDQVEEAYNSLVKKPHENISALFNYSHKEENIPESCIYIHPQRVTSHKIRIGIIGAGSFIQANHLANILGMSEDYELIGIADKTPAITKTLSEKYKVNYVTTDFRQLLSDHDIDLIIIGTRHNLHAIQVTESIKSGKNVLVEKPLAMNHNELSMIEEAIRSNPNVVATVGFNRRYSPLIQKVKQIIKDNGTPIVINYRVNSGYLPPEIWIQDLEEGGGRIVGEVCHFIDLMKYISFSRVKQIDAIFIPTDNNTIKSEDNIIVTMTFENGSIGTLTYTSLGGKGMEKERIEIFLNQISIIIHDFKELQLYNCDEKGIKMKKADKGQKALMMELAKKLKNQESLILPFEEDMASTRLTLSISDQIHKLKSD